MLLQLLVLLLLKLRLEACFLLYFLAMVCVVVVSGWNTELEVLRCVSVETCMQQGTRSASKTDQS